MSAVNLSDVDGGENQASAKTRFVMKVADSTEEFIDAFTLACNTEFKNQIAGTVHPDSIRAALAKVDVDQVLGRDAAYTTFKTAYGFKTWLLAPEEGVRGLLREAIQLYSSPLKQELDDVHVALVDASKAAMEKSGRRKGKGWNKGTAAAVAGSLDASLRDLLLDQAVHTVGVWRDQTWEQLSRNLHAESEFPAPERFAVLKARLQQLLGAAAAQRSAQLAAEHKRQLAASLGLSIDALPLAPGAVSAPKIPAAVAAVATAVQDDIPSWSEFYMGWLEKKSRRGLWQRRWFALSVRQQRMWYFGHPEEQPARGTVDLKGAMLLAEEQGEDKLALRVVLPTAFAAAVDGSSAAEKQHQDNMAAFTGSKTKTQALAVALRAGSAGSKAEWLDMLGKAIVGVPPQQAQQAPPPLPVLEHLALEESSNGVERKISTKVFADSRASGSTTKPAAAEEHKAKKSATTKGKKPEAAQAKESKIGARNLAPAPSSSDSATVSEEDEFHELEKGEGETDKEVDEEARVEAELRLFEEISLQAEEDEPTIEEWNMLECVSKAVKEYVEEAQVALTEQASKVIADGMLPMNRADELHAALLKVLSDTDGQGVMGH